jgi:hypothetical protein
MGLGALGRVTAHAIAPSSSTTPNAIGHGRESPFGVGSGASAAAAPRATLGILGDSSVSVLGTGSGAGSGPRETSIASS